MARNLDLTALRALVTVCDSGSVTRAAQLLNLTQSAVSMQLRRLEEGLGVTLFLRGPRRMEPTAEGLRLVEFARRMLALNDEALAAMGRHEAIETLHFGVPNDLISPQIPPILRLMAVSWPRLRIVLTVQKSAALRTAFAAGALQMILTTETAPGPGGIALGRRRLEWVGLPGMRPLNTLPLRLAIGRTCAFRPIAIAALEAARIGWENVIEGDSDAVVDATIAAGMAVSVRLEGSGVDGFVPLGPEARLPALGQSAICFYEAPGIETPAVQALRAEVLRSFAQPMTLDPVAPDMA